MQQKRDFADGVIADCMRFVEWPPEGKLNELSLMILVGATEKILR